MAGCVYLRFAVFVLFVALVGFSHESSTSSPGGKNVSNDSRMETANLTNASINCGDNKIKLHINKSDIENILKLMLPYTTNVVEIELTIHSKNETRSFPKYKWSWASEVGRTIISFIEQPLNILNYKPSSLQFITLKWGIEKVNVAVFEEIDGCLPTGSGGSELVFDYLLHQLSHSDDTHDYKLCRTYDDEDGFKLYNCCRITSNELSVCGNYSLNAIESVRSYVTAIACIISFFGFPLIIQYLRISNKTDGPNKGNNIPNEGSNMQNEEKDYGISDSPVALTRLFREFFVEGSSPTKSRLRRFFLLFTTTILVFISSRSILIIFIGICLLFLHVPFDIFSLNKFGKHGCTEMYDSYIVTIISLFNAHLWWKVFDKLLLQKCEKTVCKICVAIISIIIFPFVFTIVCLVSLCSLMFVVLHGTYLIRVQDADKILKSRLIRLVSYISAAWFIYTLAVFLNSMISLIAGIYLNGQIFGPYFTPITGAVVYSLKHWRWSIEAKYLVLKTNIYEVCKEMWAERLNQHSPGTPNQQTPEGQNQQPPAGQLQLQPPGGQNQQPPARQMNFTVNVKDGRIPKSLYKAIRKLILPLNKSLFFFFLQMFFVANFFLVVLAIMLLAQKSNISGPVQIMSTIALSTLPFIFDTMWVEDSFEQKNADSLKQKNEIKTIMTLVSRDVNTKTITVKVTTKEDIRIEEWIDVIFAFNPLLKPKGNNQQDQPDRNQVN